MIPGHPHTVRTTPIPLYMRGIGRLWHLGQDDPTIYDPSGDLIPPSSSDPGSVFLPSLPAPIVAPGSIDPSMYDPNAPLIAPTSGLSAQDQALAQLYQSSVAAGTMTPAQATSAIAQLMTAGAATAKAAQGLTTAPSPRVAVPAVPGAANSLTAATVIPGVPNWTLLAAAAVAAFAMGQR
jgi:hypothetical protein